MEIKESPIPPNVREQCRIELQKWREENKFYYETHNFPSMIDKVRNQSFVTFVGVPGSGKSATAHHIALKLQEEGYEVVPTTDIMKVKNYCDPQNPQVFVIDDVVGVLGLQKTKLDMLADHKRNIKNRCMKRSRTLMTCREIVFNEVLSYKPFFTDELKVVKLHSSENALTDNDKKGILKKYGLDDQTYNLDIDSLLPLLPASTSRKFPFLCKLFSKGKNFQAFGEMFFQKPVQCIMDEFDSMQRDNKLHYATLVLCVMKDNWISRDDLNDEDFAKGKRYVLEKCKLESHTDTFKFEDALLAMEGTYTKQNGDGQYSFIHDSIYEICAYHFGKQFPDQILECMSIIYISNFVKLKTNESRIEEKQNISYLRDESTNANKFRNREEDKDTESKDNDNVINDSEDSFDLCIMLSEEQYPLLARRMYREIEGMELYEVFGVAALKHPQVCKAFIAELKTKSYAALKSLFLHQTTITEKIVSKNNSILEGTEDKWSEVREMQRLLVTERLISNETTPHVRVIRWVIYYGHSEILKFIVEQTQEHHEEGELFMTARNSQHEHTDKEEIQKLEVTRTGSNDQCIDINSAFEQIRLLLLSCYSGDLETFEIILSHASLPSINETYLDNADDTDYLLLRSPLTVACSRGHAVMGYKLLKSGADVNIQDRRKYTPLIAACNGGHVDVVDMLVKENANVDLQDGYGNTPLVTACYKGHVGVVELLMKAGTDIRDHDNNGYTPLVTASREGHLDVVELLLKAGADFRQRDNNGYTALVVACHNGHLGLVEFLVKAGADIRECDNEGHTPLVTACHKGHVGLLEFLVKAGADIRESDNSGLTPLVTACHGGNVGVVEWLLKAGADIRQRDNKGYTPLVTACRGGHVHVAELLLKAGADVRESDKKRTTPLIAACMYGHENVVDKLVELGADVNLKSGFGHTPLGSASFKGNVNIVKMLLKYGADINQRNSKGKTALEIACKQGNKRVIDELRKALDR